MFTGCVSKGRSKLNIRDFQTPFFLNFSWIFPFQIRKNLTVYGVRLSARTLRMQKQFFRTQLTQVRNRKIEHIGMPIVLVQSSFEVAEHY